MKKIIRFIFIFFIVFTGWGLPCSESRGALGDVVHSIGVSGTNWGGGGITWRDGYLWEHVRRDDYLYQRDPVTGETVSEIWININNGAAIAWDTTRGTWWVTDPYDPDNSSPGTAYDDILQFKANGGSHISGFEPGLYDSDIFYDSQLDRIWVASNNPPGGGYLAKFTVDGARDGSKIYPGFEVQGVARAGDYLWVGNFSEEQGATYSIYQMTLDGRLTGVSFGTPGNVLINALTFDGNYLWALAPSHKAIYQIDIEDGGAPPPPPPIPPSPTPPPGPTPAPANSFEYRIDNLFADNAFTDLYDTDNTILNEEGNLRYWCPKVTDGEIEGTVVYRIQLPLIIETAYLNAAGAVFWENGELTVEISTDNRTYHQLYHIPRGEGDSITNNETYQITSYVRGSSTIYLRARMRTWSRYCAQFLRGDSSSTRLLHLQGTGYVASSRPPVIESGDYDGDGDTDIAVFRESTGLWSVRDVSRLYFGQDGDTPVSGDYNGDGTTDIAIFRESSGLWVVNGISRIYFGTGGDLPVPGDYNNDGRCDIALFRDSSGLWAINGISRVYFGTGGDRPVPADYNEDGGTEIALFRDSSGLWAIRDHSRIYFGTGGDIAIPARYYPNVNRALCAVFRPSTGLWSIRGVSRFYFGGSSDYPVPGDYARAGHAQAAVFGDGNGRWAIRGVSRAYFGTTSDIPVTR